MSHETHFWKHGYTIVRGLFEPSECDKWRSEAIEHREHPGDLLSHPQLWSVILEARLLEVVARILGDTPVYFGDSSAKFGVHGRGYHKDNADRYDPSAPDWQGRYPIIRCGIYLQDHTQHSGGLNIRDGSHMTPRVTEGRTRYMNTALGDVVIWNLRTSHSANGVLLKGPGALTVTPKAVRFLPQALIRDAGPERVALFMTFGAPGPHLDRYLTYLKTRTYQIDLWRLSPYKPEVIKAAESSPLTLDPIWPRIKDDPDLGQNRDYVQLPY